MTTSSPPPLKNRGVIISDGKLLSFVLLQFLTLDFIIFERLIFALSFR